MIIADIDGTLVGWDRHVSPRVREAVASAMRAGVLVTLATGRWYRSAQPIAAELGLELPMILHNGALVKDSLTGEVLHHSPLPWALAREAARTVRRHGMQPILYEDGGEAIVAGPPEEDSPGAARYLMKEGVRRVPIDVLELTADPLELLVVDTAERVEPLLAELTCDRWRTVTSMSIAVPNDRLVEVLSLECSKTNAVEALARRYGVSFDEIMAVGDNFNDLDMIESAGYGVAMGNAPAAVQARANWVAPRVDEDGLAVAIERALGLPSGRSVPVGGGGS
jgi:Cof subfamily protein (haloacid dehalogenase superfamily)